MLHRCLTFRTRRNTLLVSKCSPVSLPTSVVSCVEREPREGSCEGSNHVIATQARSCRRPFGGQQRPEGSLLWRGKVWLERLQARGPRTKWTKRGFPMDAFRSHWDCSLNIAASFLLFLGVALALVPASPAFADRVVEGAVTVVRDVDTIVVAGVPVRLNGVDGPETSSRVGRDARTFMERLLTGQTVSCVLSGDRTYDRWVGVCYLAGQDIGAIAIANGHALDCPRYSGGRYSSLETPASRSRLPRARYCR